MAKMNLSVIMQTIDKTSAVVKKITSTQSKYAKQLGQVKEQSQKISGNQALISNFRKTGAEASKNKTKLNGAKDKLSQLNEKMTASKKPSAALQNQFKKQQLAVKSLKSVQSEYTRALTKTQNKLKTAGVNVSRLSSEEKRLSTEYNKRISQMDKLAKKEARLQKVRAKLAKIKLPNIVGSIGKAGAVIGGTSAALAGLMTVTNHNTSEMVSMAKSYDMSIAKFTQWDGIAKQAGLSGEAVGDMVEELTNKFGEYKALGKQSSVSDAFGVLKLNKSMLKGKSGVQQFELIMKRLQGLKDKQKAASIADMLFSGDSNKLVTYIKNSGTSLDGLLKSQKKVSLLTENGANGAVLYSKAFKVLQSTVTSAWAEISGIVGGEFSGDIKKLSEQLSEFVRNNKKEIVVFVKALVKHLKTFGKVVVFIAQHIPEVVAGLVLFKIAMFALNAAMIVNPIGLIVAAVAAVAVGITYLIVKAGGVTEAFKLVWETFKNTAAIINDLITPSVDGMGGTFDRVKAVFVSGIALIKTQFLVIPRAIMKALSLIPSKLLPDGWGDSIKNAQKQLEEMNSGIVNDAKANIEYAVTGDTDNPISDRKKDSIKEAQNQLKKMNIGIVNDVNSKIEYAPTNNADKPLQSAQRSEMLKHPSIQSKSQVEVRIKSDKPVEITQAKSDKHTEMMVDTGELLGSGF